MLRPLSAICLLLSLLRGTWTWANPAALGHHRHLLHGRQVLEEHHEEHRNLEPRQGHSPLPGGCQFDSAKSPSCWGQYSLSTNFYDDGPDTGRTREYFFDVTNTTMAPDGFQRILYTINGQFPGPAIEADWGDTVVVHLRNQLTTNGTTLHFHGLRQHDTTAEDGVMSITQCPIAPGDTYTYKWKATQYGTSWYHSHYKLQAWNGVYGPIIIKGPASAPYDEDLGVVFLSDWYHDTVDYLFHYASAVGPPKAQSGLLNGKGMSNSGGGSRFQTVFQPGKRYRLRIINSAIDVMFKFMIDGHALTVIANDLVPIVPYTTKAISVGIAQRYDVIVMADQPVGNYWMRAVPLRCGSEVEAADNIKGIVRYDPGSTQDPTTQPWEHASECLDEPAGSLVPSLPLDVGAKALEDDITVTFDVSTGVIKWLLDNTTFLTDWTLPTIQRVIKGDTAYDAQEMIMTLQEANKWIYVVMENPGKDAHPIHLHGHDFHVLAQGGGKFDGKFNTKNTPRRDVAILEGNGHLVIAFITDNPGIWLCHCHVGWHASQGFALQFIERPGEIGKTVDVNRLNTVCNNWNSYLKSSGLKQIGSGL